MTVQLILDCPYKEEPSYLRSTVLSLIDVVFERGLKKVKNGSGNRNDTYCGVK